MSSIMLLILFLVALTSFSFISCKENADCNIDSVLQTDPHPDFAETARNLQAQWVAKDSILVVASEASTTNVWLGSKQQTGLFQFQKHDGQIQEEVNPGSMKISPVERKIAVLVSSNKQSIYTSRDAGVSWTKQSVPGNNVDEISFSKVNPSIIIITNADGGLYISYDLGVQWSKISSYVVSVVFAQDPTDKKEYLFYSTKQGDSPVNNLHRCSIHTSGYSSSSVILSGMFRFFVDSKYLFASKENYTSTTNIIFSRTRRFYVSTNFFGSNPTFNEVELPVAKWSDHVQVMATHETGAFIHMSTNGDNVKGTLYVSDRSGIRFTKSLKNHLVKRVSIFSSAISFHDFYVVDSVRGVYITVNVSGDKDEQHTSVITFNNGGTWQLLKPPTNSDCSLPQGCSLHLHSTYSTIVSHVSYNQTLKNGPLSSSNAPGIIIAQGSIGKSRDYDPTKSVIVTSQDGGQSWTQPDIPSGQYTYGIADYGTVIAIVPDGENADYIWFSHDRGVCFKKEQLDTTKFFKLSKGLIMDPTTTSLFAFALGLEGNTADDAWRMIAINFGSVLSSPCHKEDYITVGLGNSCIMGYKEQYQVVKSSSVCYTDGYSPNPTITHCNCSYNDMECELGYSPSWSDDGVLTCTLNKNDVTLDKLCQSGEKYYYQSKSGLRVVAGNKCTNTTETAKLLAYERNKCAGHSDISGVDEADQSHSSSGRTAAQVIGAIIIIVALLAAAGLVVYCLAKFRKPREFHDRVVYKKIPLTENGFSEDSESDDDLLH